MWDLVRQWEVRRLNANQLLVSTPCWSAAYNNGAGAWVVNERPPYAPVLVTDSATDINDTEVFTSHKSRGLGDCFCFQAWAWNGTRFEPSSTGSTGMCRAIQHGGAWELPTLVTRVRPRGAPEAAAFGTGSAWLAGPRTIAAWPPTERTVKGYALLRLPGGVNRPRGDDTILADRAAQRQAPICWRSAIKR